MNPTMMPPVGATPAMSAAKPAAPAAPMPKLPAEGQDMVQFSGRGKEVAKKAGVTAVLSAMLLGAGAGVASAQDDGNSEPPPPTSGNSRAERLDQVRNKINARIDARQEHISNSRANARIDRFQERFNKRIDARIARWSR